MRLLLVLLAACSGVNGDIHAVQTLASGLANPSVRAQDSMRLYVVEDGTELVAIPKAGGAAVLVASGHAIDAVAADDQGVYWLDLTGATTTAWGVAAGTHDPLELGTATSTPAKNLALDVSSLYYADTAGTVWQVARTGGIKSIGTTDAVTAAVAADPVNLDGTEVWVAAQHGARWFHGSATTIGISDLIFDQTAPDALAVDFGVVYALFAGDGAADGYIVTTGYQESPRTIATQLWAPTGFAYADGDLYVAQTTPGGGYELDRFDSNVGGGAATPIARGAAPNALVADYNYLYWTLASGDVRCVAR